jgi:hypothetical protein
VARSAQAQADPRPPRSSLSAVPCTRPPVYWATRPLSLRLTSVPGSTIIPRGIRTASRFWGSNEELRNHARLRGR